MKLREQQIVRYLISVFISIGNPPLVKNPTNWIWQVKLIKTFNIENKIHQFSVSKAYKSLTGVIKRFREKWTKIPLNLPNSSWSREEGDMTSSDRVSLLYSLYSISTRILWCVFLFGLILARSSWIRFSSALSRMSSKKSWRDPYLDVDRIWYLRKVMIIINYWVESSANIKFLLKFC